MVDRYRWNEEVRRTVQGQLHSRWMDSRPEQLVLLSVFCNCFTLGRGTIVTYTLLAYVLMLSCC